MNKIIVQAPATIANLSCGYDILGLAVKSPFDQITISKEKNKKGIVIDSISGFSKGIPIDIKKNVVTYPMLKMLDDYSISDGFKVEIKKGIPIAGGMGSSAASSVAGVFGLNKLLDLRLSKKEIIKYALLGEELATGAGHADNVSPCLFGGITLIRQEPFDIFTIPTNIDLYASIIKPNIELRTKDGRNILPRQIILEDAVKQWSNIASLVLGFLKNDVNIIKESQYDYIVEPIRKKLIPNYDLVKKVAIESGAILCNISGSGPSIFALSKSEKNANLIGDKMKAAMTTDSDVFISRINKAGCKYTIEI